MTIETSGGGGGAPVLSFMNYAKSAATVVVGVFTRMLKRCIEMVIVGRLTNPPRLRHNKVPH